MRAVSPLVDAWRAICPTGKSSENPVSTWLILLTVVSGVIDAFCYLALGHVFVANTTGNVVFVGFTLAGAPGFSLWASLLAIAAFLVGALAGGMLTHRTTTPRKTLLFIAVSYQFGAVSVALIVGLTVQGNFTEPVGRAVTIALLAVGLGIQNAIVRALAVPDFTTTVITLTMAGIAADSRLAGGPGSRLGRRGLSIVAIGIGATAGAALEIRVGPLAALGLADALIAIALVGTWRFSRATRPWVEHSHH
jgi:uncharacterized membrane protein YoaK (UPF0700 family)